MRIKKQLLDDIIKVPFQFSDSEVTREKEVGLPILDMDINANLWQINIKSEYIHLIATKK